MYKYLRYLHVIHELIFLLILFKLNRVSKLFNWQKLLRLKKNPDQKNYRHSSGLKIKKKKVIRIFKDGYY